MVRRTIVAALWLVGLAHAQRLATLSEDFRQLARRVHPSVVKVVATGYRGLEEEEATSEPGVLSRQQSSGSGVIIDREGLIVTNAHVVISARRIQVTLPPARDETRKSALRPAGRLLSADLIGFDLETDIALLRVSEKGLPALSLADSEAIEQGQIVLAFGSPLGLDNSVSFGVVSSTARQLKPDDPMIYIQTDAPINPGSSGGPLVDAEGNVIGINTLILSQSGGNEGLGFAVPSSIVANVVEQLQKTGRVVRGEIGVQAQSIDPILAKAWTLPQEWGVVVSDVEEESGGARAGLEPGDVVLTLDGKVMENARQFNVNLYRPPIGSSVRLEVLRDRKRMTVTVDVSERKTEPEHIAAQAAREENLIPQLGVFVMDFTDKLRAQLGPLRKDDGILVAARAADGPLFEEGLKTGDVIYAINRQPVQDVAALRRELAKFNPGDAVALQIERTGSLRYLAFLLP